jgi:Winged helix DNA-binding domain
MAEKTLPLREINRATLARQMLLARERRTPLEAIEHLIGLQAQWPRPPFVGLWTRLEGFERAHLASLFEARTAVRATFLRATIHVLSARDFLALRPAIQPILDGAHQAILKDRLDGVDLDAVTKRARGFFEKSPRPFEDLREFFLADDPKCDERALGYAVRMRLPLVQVPEPGAAWSFPAQACFTTAEQWLGKKVPLKPTTPDALIHRYLAAYGPSSAADVAAWSALAKPAVRDALERLRPELIVFRDEKKRELFDLPDAPRPPADTPAPIRFVPEYDNLVNTRADERFVATAHRPRVFLSALRLAATVLVDGFVAATWKIQATKKKATLTIEPFAPLPARVRKAIGPEAEALARFSEPDVPTVDITFADA